MLRCRFSHLFGKKSIIFTSNSNSTILKTLRQHPRELLKRAEILQKRLHFGYILAVRSTLKGQRKIFKSRQNTRVDFFPAKKRLRRVQNGVFPLTVVEFWGRWIVYNSRLFAQKRPFCELSVSQQEKFGQTTNFIYDKQI